MNKAIPYLAILLLVVLSCNNNLIQTNNLSICNKLEKEAIKSCGNGTSGSFSVKDITNFKWDTLYIFSSHADKPTIESIIGFDYLWDDPGDKLIFVKNGKAVYVENIFVDKTGISFDLENGPRSKYILLSSYHPDLLVDKKKLESSADSFYLLGNRYCTWNFPHRLGNDSLLNQVTRYLDKKQDYATNIDVAIAASFPPEGIGSNWIYHGYGIRDSIISNMAYNPDYVDEDFKILYQKGWNTKYSWTINMMLLAHFKYSGITLQMYSPNKRIEWLKNESGEDSIGWRRHFKL